MYCKPHVFCEREIINKSIFSANAEAILLNIAKDEDVDAMFTVGVLLQEKHLLSSNYDECLKYYESAANQGHVIAMRNLGILYQVGLSTDIDWNKSAYWYEKAFLKGDLISAENLQYLYLNGWRPTVGNLNLHKWQDVVKKKSTTNEKTLDFEIMQPDTCYVEDFEAKNNSDEEIEATNLQIDDEELYKQENTKISQTLRNHKRPLRVGSLQQRLLGRIYAAKRRDL